MTGSQKYIEKGLEEINCRKQTHKIVMPKELAKAGINKCHQFLLYFILDSKTCSARLDQYPHHNGEQTKAG